MLHAQNLPYITVFKALIGQIFPRNGVFTPNLPSQKNLVNESLSNCDVMQVLCILTIFCRFKPKNVCIFPKFSSFQLFQSEIILVKCCKEVIVPLEYFFEFLSRIFLRVCVYSSSGFKIHPEVANF